VEFGTREVEGGFVWKWDPAFRTGIPDGFSLELILAQYHHVTAPTLALVSSEEDAWTEVDDEEAASGRFVLLHDPDGQEPWDGQFRVVSFTKGTVELDIAQDPMLTEVAWSWLVEALDDPSLIVRRYASKAIIDMTQPSVVDRMRYRPDGQPDTRREGVVWWRNQLEKGLIRRGALASGNAARTMDEPAEPAVPAEDAEEEPAEQ
jgi:hypothetical protein